MYGNEYVFLKDKILLSRKKDEIMPFAARRMDLEMIILSLILSNLSTMTRPSWVAPRAWLSFIELRQGCGPSAIRLTSFL